MTKVTLEQRAREMGIEIDVTDNLIERLKEKQRGRMKTRLAEAQQLKRTLGFSFDCIPRGYRTQSWTPGIRRSK